ncbi:hypothetical protein JCM14036_28300 [Desulfotomaculum defluvii]
MTLVNFFRAREFQLRVVRQKYITRQQLQKQPHKFNNILHVVYLLGHVSVCGGVKVILEHANELFKVGAQVSLLSHFPRPDWFDIKADYIQIPFGLELARGIPADCDLVVATYWDQLAACVEACAAPVVYFEQGDFHLWDWERVSEDKQKLIYHLYQLPSYIITCSHTGAKKIKEVFQRDALVFHNALNNEVFFPKKELSKEKWILGVGSEHTKFKRIPDIWQACQIVQSKGYDIHFKWVTQSNPTKPLGTVVVNPPQPILGDIYRQAQIYICASEYETFPLPPLEAMACGTPVITTANDGALAYAVDRENCLYFTCGDTDQLANKIITLLEDQGLYNHLQQNGYKTASRFQWQEIISQLKTFYEEAAQHQAIPIHQETDWVKLMPISFSPEDQRTIAQFLGHTAADLIYLPFVYELNEHCKLTRWHPIFQRKLALSGQVDHLYLSFQVLPLEDHPYYEAISVFVAENYTEAFQYFKKHLDTNNNPQEVAVLLRWLIWCLIKAKLYSEAQSLLNKGFKNHPGFADLYYLYGLLVKLSGNDQELTIIRHNLTLLGDAVGFPEYIKDVYTLL